MDQTFDDFFSSAWPWARRLAAFLVQDQTAGEDIAQQALTKMADGWGSHDNPEAYLRRSLTNASNNWHRHNNVRRAKLPLLVEQDSVDFAANELADALAALPFRQRAVLVFRYYADLSEADIARALDCAPGTVKSLASRALDTLSKEIPR